MPGAEGRGGGKMKISINDALRLFYATKSEKCPYCGNDSWDLVDPPDTNATWSVIAVTPDGAPVPSAPVIPTVTLVCDTCFSVRLVSYLGLRNWLLDNGLENAIDDL